MRFMVIVRATKDSEAGVLPDEKLLADMGKFNEELVKAGVMLAGEGLQPSSKGARVRFSGTKRTVIDGPFAETKELIAGFWLWKVKSKEEAIEWVKRCPNPTGPNPRSRSARCSRPRISAPSSRPSCGEQEERLRAADGEASGRLSSSQVRHCKTQSLKETTMHLNPYLTFNGQCEAAFRFYEECLGGKIVAMMTHAETPAEEQISPEWRDKIMHARLAVGDRLLMGSDARRSITKNPRVFGLAADQDAGGGGAGL